MPEAAAPVPVVAEPTKIPPPIAAGPQGAAALTDEPTPVQADPFEFEVDVKGQKQTLKFANKDQLTAVLQKALYADQVIKDATQAKKGAAEMMQKLKTPQGIKEIFADPDINVDVKKFALEIVQEMMEDEKLSPNDRRLRELEKYQSDNEAEKKAKLDASEQEKKQAELNKAAAEARGQIIEAMKKYPDIPQTQATMDACILNMRAAYRRFGKHLTPEQAMSVYSEQYWTSVTKTLENMSPEKIMERFGQKNFDKIQKLKLNQLKDKTDPSKQKSESPLKQKKNLTEKEFEKHFQELAGGL